MSVLLAIVCYFCMANEMNIIISLFKHLVVYNIKEKIETMQQFTATCSKMVVLE